MKLIFSGYLFVLVFLSLPLLALHKGLYLDPGWYRKEKTPAQWQNLKSQLAKQQISDLYFYLEGPLQKISPEHIQATIHKMTHGLKHRPRVHGFIGRRICSIRFSDHCQELSTPAVQEKLSQEIVQLWTKFGFTYAHVDFEQISDQDQHFLGWLKKVKSLKPKEKKLSIAGYFLIKDDFPHKEKVKPRLLRWSGSYITKVLQEVDHYVVMAYDTALKSVFDYKRFVVTQTKFFLSLAEKNPDKTLLVGLPAYFQGRKGLFDRNSERFEVAMDGFTEAIINTKVPNNFGLALFIEQNLTKESWQRIARVM